MQAGAYICGLKKKFDEKNIEKTELPHNISPVNHHIYQLSKSGAGAEAGARARAGEGAVAVVAAALQRA